MPENAGEFQNFCQQNQIQLVTVMLPDANGCARGKLIPVKKFLSTCDTGFQFARSVLVQDIEGENAPVTGFDIHSGDADMLGVPLVETLHLMPWKSGTAGVILEVCDIETREPLPQSCRTLLKSVLAHLAAEGLEAKVASELEFYLFTSTGEQLGTGSPAYSLTALARLKGFAEDLIRYTEAIGLQVEACLHEYAPGQIEINFAPSDPLSMADRTFLFRQMVKEAAISVGLEATFLAKPLSGHSGSGYHLHVSLWQEDRNLFWDAPSGAISKQLAQFTAGQVKYTPELFALYLPNVNSYRRHLPGEYVPTSASWGGDDRTVAFRVPRPGPLSARLEHRIAGADANPYLLIAGVLLAGLAGLKENLPPLDLNTPGSGELFPLSHPQALNRFEQSQFVSDWIGAEFRDVYLAVKRQEWDKYHRVISAWERDIFGAAL